MFSDDKLLLEEDILFDEEEHTYTGTVSGEEYISATTLLKKYGLTPSEYATIPKEILARAAAYGTAVHKALEEYILGDETQLLVPEVQAFKDWLDANTLTTLDCVAEKKVFNEYYKVAGTVDLQVWNIIADFKTTASLHLVPVMWQLSLYNFLLHPNETDYSMHELKVFWFSASGTLTVRDIPLIPYDRLLNMLEAHKRGEEVWVDDTVPSDLIELADAVVKQKRLIDTLKRNLKTLENEQDVLKTSLEEQMKEEERIYVDSPSGFITLTEVSQSRFDTKKVRGLLKSLSLPEIDYVNVSTYTRMSIKDKAK